VVFRTLISVQFDTHRGTFLSQFFHGILHFVRLRRTEKQISRNIRIQPSAGHVTDNDKLFQCDATVSLLAKEDSSRALRFRVTILFNSAACTTLKGMLSWPDEVRIWEAKRVTIPTFPCRGPGNVTVETEGWVRYPTGVTFF
jgi:hypothetical protein